MESSLNNTKQESDNAAKGAKNGKKRIENLFESFKKCDPTTKANVVMAVCSVVSIVIFIYVSIHQSSQTRESLDLATENYIDENRPFVFASFPTVKQTRFGEYVAKIPITNHGKTPAYNVTQGFRFDHWRTIEDPRSYPYPDTMNTGILAPAFPDTEDVFPEKARWDTNMTDPNSRFYITGAIWYKDYWGTKHYTTFAYEWYFRNDRFVRLQEYESADQRRRNY